MNPQENIENTWPRNPNILHLAYFSNRCTVLGPGIRAVLWAQGCPFQCIGCIAPEMAPFQGGIETDVDVLSKELSYLPDIEGITFSGGEPMMQADALCNLIDKIRSIRELSFLCYTGFILQDIQKKGTQAQQALLQKLDILIDGPYIQSRHTDLRWRGSDNQKVYFLTPRYQHLASILEDRGTWLEFEIGKKQDLHWMGIPPQGFRKSFELAMRNKGIFLEHDQ